MVNEDYLYCRAWDYLGLGGLFEIIFVEQMVHVDHKVHYL